MLVDKRRKKGRVGMEGLEGLIQRLLEGRNNRGKRIQLTEPEIHQLCVTAKQVFLAQPVLLALEAPINICGTSFSSFLHPSTHLVLLPVRSEFHNQCPSFFFMLSIYQFACLFVWSCSISMLPIDYIISILSSSAILIFHLQCWIDVRVILRIDPRKNDTLLDSHISAEE